MELEVNSRGRTKHGLNLIHSYTHQQLLPAGTYANVLFLTAPAFSMLLTHGTGIQASSR